MEVFHIHELTKNLILVYVLMSTKYNLDLHISQKRKDLKLFFSAYEKGGIEFYL